jgi:hypothetical protein
MHENRKDIKFFEVSLHPDLRALLANQNANRGRFDDDHPSTSTQHLNIESHKKSQKQQREAKEIKPAA